MQIIRRVLHSYTLIQEFHLLIFLSIPTIFLIRQVAFKGGSYFPRCRTVRIHIEALNTVISRLIGNRVIRLIAIVTDRLISMHRIIVQVIPVRRIIDRNLDQCPPGILIVG